MRDGGRVMGTCDACCGDVLRWRCEGDVLRYEVVMC